MYIYRYIFIVSSMFSEYYADYKLEFAFPVAVTLTLYVTFISS